MVYFRNESLVIIENVLANAKSKIY